MNFTYFLSNFVPVLLVLAIIWRTDTKLLKKAVPVLIILGFLGLINAFAENPGLRWGIWYYNLPNTMGVTFFRVLLETYIYCILVPIAIGSGAIKIAQRLERKNGSRKK